MGIFDKIFGKKQNTENGEKTSVKVKLSPDEKKRYKILPYEKEEETNPKIRLYNEMVRSAMTYDTEPISRKGVTSDEDIKRIFYYVLDDYPEIFWVEGWSWTSETFSLTYRCLDENGNIDIKQIESKRAQLKKSAKYFTRGITKRTKPYDALLTIYRRIILTLDYDGRGLHSGAGKDVTKDDRLRSLYSAIVEHKVVCAGYAVAVQYLLQSVGISCGVVGSEDVGGSGHAFNALKIGKYCYYLDATWGDFSNTETGDDYKNDILYDYCCVPYKEFIQTSDSYRGFHQPSKMLYPNLEEFTATNHEYFRFKKAYLTRYDEQAIVKVFANAAMHYDAKEMGNFTVGFRCFDIEIRDYVLNKLRNPEIMKNILNKAKNLVKKKKQQELLDKGIKSFYPSTAPIFYVRFN